MGNCQMLHETIVRDVIDVVDGIKNYDQIEWINNKNRTGSIAKQASNLVLVFPVLVSNSLSIATAAMITKAIERKCSSLLEILFASINFTDADNLQDFIGKFHRNFNSKMSLDDFMTTMDDLTESGQIEVINKEEYDAVMEDMKNLNYYLDNTFNENAINNYKYKTDKYGNHNIVLLERYNKKSKNKNNQSPRPSRKNYGSNNPLTRNDIDNIKIKIQDKVNDALARHAKPDVNIKNEIDWFKDQLLSQEVKKANELQPTLLAVRFTAYSEKTHSYNTTTGIVGVKAKIYPVDSMEIISRLSSKYSDSNSLFKLVKASTREISFFKDFAFAIDKAKLDAINMAKQSSNAKMFKLLERRASKNKFSSLLKKNDASPITSLVISQSEVDYLLKYNNIDMTKSHVARTILESYNLMCITIADESLEIAKFLYDDDDGVFEVMPFDSLEKEASDNSYKKVVNLMSKINR